MISILHPSNVICTWLAMIFVLHPTNVICTWLIMNSILHPPNAVCTCVHISVAFFHLADKGLYSAFTTICYLYLVDNDSLNASTIFYLFFSTLFSLFLYFFPYLAYNNLVMPSPYAICTLLIMIFQPAFTICYLCFVTL